MKIKIVSLLYVISIILFLGFKFVSLPYFFRYGMALVWIAYAYSKKYALNPLNKKILEKLVLPYIVIAAVSLPLYFINGLPSIGVVSMITRLGSIFVQAIINVLFVFASYSIFHGESIHYIFEGLLINNIIGLFWAIYRYGIRQFIQFIRNPFSNTWSIWVREGTVATALELSELTFTLGFFLIYFIMFYEKRNRKLKWSILISIILVILGFKRIQMLGLAGMLIVNFLTQRKKKKSSFGFSVMLIYIAFQLALLGYVFIISNNTLQLLANKYNINLMSRGEWFGNLTSYFSFSPLYLGRGWGVVSRLSEVLNQGVHNDVLRYYIELGFGGFIVWTYYYIRYLSIYFAKRNIYAGKIFLNFIVYAFITYLTDNTSNYFVFQLVLMIIPLHIVNTEQGSHQACFVTRRAVRKKDVI